MKRLLVLISVLISLSAFASDRDTSSVFHRIGVDVRPGALTKHHDFFRGENALGKPLKADASFHLKYSFCFPSNTLLGRLYPTAYQGVGLAAYTFGNPDEIGNPVALYVFQGARIADLGHNLSLDYEWNFGVSMGWRPYDPPSKNGTNTFNSVVGTKVNAYMNAGLFLSWHPSESWTVSAGLDLTHFSNGDTTFPNTGVNSIGARFGVTRSFAGRPFVSGNSHYGRRRPAMWFVDRLTLDIIPYGAWNEEFVSYEDKEYHVDGKFAVAGLHVNPLCSVAFPWLSVGPSLDIQYNEGMNIQNHIAGVNHATDEIRFYRPSFLEQFAVGLSVRAELQMPVFALNFGVGHNVIYKGEELGGIYSVLTLKTFVSKKCFLNVGLKMSSRECSNNLMLGLGWRIGN